MPKLILASAPSMEARAEAIAEKLTMLGFTVSQDVEAEAASPHARRRLDAEIDAAACMLVLWSKDAAPSLTAAAQRAKARGKLALARLDAAPAPFAVRPASAVDLSSWSGRDTRAWRALVAALPAPSRAASAPTQSPTPLRVAASHAAPSPSVVPAQPPAKKGGIGFGIGLAFLFGLAAAGIGLWVYGTQHGLIP